MPVALRRAASLGSAAMASDGRNNTLRSSVRALHSDKLSKTSCTSAWNCINFATPFVSR